MACLSVTQLDPYREDGNPKNSSRLRALARSLRPVGLRPFLTIGGFGFISAAAYTVALGLGLLVTGLALLALEYLTVGDA